MKIWTALKRLNQRYDAWAMHTADSFVAGIDRSYREKKSPGTKRHITVWDLLPGKRDPGQSRPMGSCFVPPIVPPPMARPGLADAAPRELS